MIDSSQLQLYSLKEHHALVQFFNTGIAVCPDEYHLETSARKTCDELEIQPLEPQGFKAKSDALFHRLAVLIYTSRQIASLDDGNRRLFHGGDSFPSDGFLNQPWLVTIGQPRPTLHSWLLQIHNWKEELQALAESIRHWPNAPMNFAFSAGTVIAILRTKHLGRGIRETLERYTRPDIRLTQLTPALLFEKQTMEDVTGCLAELLLRWRGDLNHAMKSQLEENAHKIRNNMQRIADGKRPRTKKLQVSQPTVPPFPNENSVLSKAFKCNEILYNEDALECPRSSEQNGNQNSAVASALSPPTRLEMRSPGRLTLGGPQSFNSSRQSTIRISGSTLNPTAASFYPLCPLQSLEASIPRSVHHDGEYACEACRFPYCSCGSEARERCL